MGNHPTGFEVLDAAPISRLDMGLTSPMAFVVLDLVGGNGLPTHVLRGSLLLLLIAGTTALDMADVSGLRLLHLVPILGNSGACAP